MKVPGKGWSRSKGKVCGKGFGVVDANAVQSAGVDVDDVGVSVVVGVADAGIEFEPYPRTKKALHEETEAQTWILDLSLSLRPGGGSETTKNMRRSLIFRAALEHSKS